MDLQALKDLIDVGGVLSAFLTIGLIFVWREWRRAEKEKVEFLNQMIAEQKDMIEKFNSFEAVIKALTHVIKG